MSKFFLTPLLKGLLIGLGILSWAGSAWSQPDEFEKMGIVKPRTVKSAPEFALKNIHGKTVTLEDFRGKTVLLNFWATWCQACKEEMPSMQRLYEQLRGRGVEIVAISIDRGNEDRVQKYVKQYGVTFPVLLDPNQNVRKRYYILGLPTSYLIGPDGKLRGFVSGSRVWDNDDYKRIFLSFGEKSLEQISMLQR